MNARTHTTAVSTYMLHKLAANPRPARYFSIDRVFRNETVDATHLAEFHQVEGVIADFGLTLGGLISFMEVFFAKMGLQQLSTKSFSSTLFQIFFFDISFHITFICLSISNNYLEFKPTYNPYTEPSMEVSSR